MDPKAMIERFLAGWSNDLPTLLPLFTDDIVYFDRPLQTELHGKEALKSFAQSFFTAFPDIKFVQTSSPILSGDSAAFEWRITGTQTGQLLHIPASNRSIDVMGVSLMALNDGRISQTTDYWDMATLLRQIGQLPS